jgi:hypothetical protein
MEPTVGTSFEQSAVVDPRIYQLIELITAQLFYHRPEDPKAFMIEQLQAIQRLKNSGGEPGSVQSLFAPEDLDVLFSMFSKNMDTITAAQTKTGFPRPP